MGCNLTDNRGIPSKWVTTHHAEGLVDVVVGDHGEEFSFIGDIKGVEAQNLAGSPYRFLERDRGLLNHRGHTSAFRRFVQYRGHSTAGRIAQEMNFHTRFEQGRHQPVQRRGVTQQVRFKP